ncbi:MAG: TonB-dependent receptor [Cyclobacteriaceae bacterium]|nr:TonB-dependent receptor [Cyclobacteriaceae bacterium]
MGLLLFASTINAQTRVVSGRVTSAEDQSALPGVNVVVKGTTTGSITDFDGNYRLEVSGQNTVLVFSFIGFLTQEVSTEGRSEINVSMANDVTELSEVVVVGYGTQQKRDLTGAISSVSGKDINNAPVQSFDQALQGRSAGVSVSSPNGALNNPPVIRIRGINSINLSSFPLVVIDGVPTYTDNISTNSAPFNPLASVNPADIESIDVLKDASATAIYGSRASAGVILITTKKGGKGNMKVNYDSWISWTSQARKNIKITGAEDFMTLKNEGLVNAGLPPAYFPSYDADGKLIDTDWSKYFFQTGFSHSNALSFSGGSDKTNYYMSIGYTDQQGFVKLNEFSRTQGRARVDHKLFKTVTIGANVSFSNTATVSANSGSVSGQTGDFANGPRLVLNVDPNIAPYNNDGSYNIGTGGAIGKMNNLRASPFPNLAIAMDKDRFSSEGSQIQASAYLNWEILKNLNLKTQYGIDRLSLTDEAYENPLQNPGFAVGGRAVNIQRLNTRWNWQNTAQYDFQLADNHNVSLLAGGEQQYTQVNRWGILRSNQSDPFFTNALGNFVNTIPNQDQAGNNIAIAGENFLLSYFGRVNYDFNKKYFATFNYRRDGYSAFAAGNKWGNFYGGSLGYSISEEDFWQNSSLSSKVNYLKLRTSYGLVGNNQGINDFASLQTYSGGLYGDKPTLYFFRAGNTELSWETSKKMDVGFSAGLLDDRISLEFAYYKNDVDGLILNVPQSPSKGVPNPDNPNIIPQNVGSMRNTGIELSLRATAIRNTDFSWVISANVTTLKNEVLSLDGDNQQILSSENVIRVGESISSLWAVPTLGVNPDNGRRLFEKADGTVVQYDLAAPSSQRWTRVSDGGAVTPINAQSDGRIQGPALPKWYGGFDNTFKYKNWDLGLFMQFSGGNYIMNGTKAGLRDQRFFNFSTDVLDRWTPTNTSGSIPRLVFGDNISNGGAALPISENVEKADFLRMRNIMLGYTLPPAVISRLKISSARIYGQVQNPFIITKYEGFDPEISVNGNSNLTPGIDRNAIGQARTISLGVNIGF